jgi:hypothetical protein
MFSGNSVLQRPCEDLRPRDDLNNAAGEGTENATLQQGSPFATQALGKNGQAAMAVCIIEQRTAEERSVFSLLLEDASSSKNTITVRVLNLVPEGDHVLRQDPSLVGGVSVSGDKLVPLDPKLVKVVTEGGMQMLYEFSDEALRVVKQLVWDRVASPRAVAPTIRTPGGEGHEAHFPYEKVDGTAAFSDPIDEGEPRTGNWNCIICEKLLAANQYNA